MWSMPDGSDRDEEFSEYVKARYSRLLATAYLLSGDRHAAEDLVQTALAKLYVAWPRLRQGGSEDAYIRRILINSNHEIHRKPWRRERAVAEVPDRLAPEPFDPADRDELIQALATLGPKQRRIIVLRYWLGLTIEEVAADLQVTTGTVKSQSSRAMETLRRRLSDFRLPDLTGDRP
jgi:RNA polymerase sigma-70 factor (sigma-E family)